MLKENKTINEEIASKLRWILKQIRYSTGTDAGTCNKLIYGNKYHLVPVMFWPGISEWNFFTIEMLVIL